MGWWRSGAGRFSQTRTQRALRVSFVLATSGIMIWRTASWDNKSFAIRLTDFSSGGNLKRVVRALPNRCMEGPSKNPKSPMIGPRHTSGADRGTSQFQERKEASATEFLARQFVATWVILGGIFDPLR